MKTAIELLADKLKEMGADGLCNHDCGCVLDDLIPCCCLEAYCVPAKKAICNEDNWDEGCVLGSEMLVPMKTKE